MNRKHLWIGFSVILAAMVACVGSTPPATSPEAVGTIVAATMQAITPLPSPTSPPSSPTVALATATPGGLPTLPVGAPTIPLPASTRINFLTGATLGMVSAPIQSGQTQFYALKALQGQLMMVTVDSVNQDVTLSIKTQGGTSLLNASAHQSTWQGTLPQTEDYYIGVYGGASTENFTLTIQIPNRIKFAEGAVSAKLNGKTVAGYNVAYTAFAYKGQKMTVDLTGLSDDAALTIYGYTDGQPYLRSVTEKTSFSFTLPATQDYIIEVVPRAGKVVSFTLAIKIE